MDSSKKMMIAAVLVSVFAMLLVYLHETAKSPEARVHSKPADLVDMTVREYRVKGYHITEFEEHGVRCYKFDEVGFEMRSGGLSCVKMNNEEVQ